MRRDMDLIRDLMLALEALPESPGGVHQLTPGEGVLAIDPTVTTMLRITYN